MNKKHKAETIRTICIAVFFFVFLSPILIVLSASFRHLSDTSNYLVLFKTFTLESYKAAFEKMHYFRSLRNSAVITCIAVVFILLFSSMAGYAIARLKGKLGSFFQIFFLSGMVVSAQMSIIPMYRVVNKLGLSDTMMAPVFLYITAALPFSIFLYTNFVKSGVPYALEEAALIDGASPGYTYLHIIIPLTKAALTALIITQGVPIWNDFFFAMLFLSDPTKKTLPLQMLNFVGDMENVTQWNMLFAACIISALPILIIYAFMQRHFVEGLTVGAVKE